MTPQGARRVSNAKKDSMHTSDNVPVLEPRAHGQLQDAIPLLHPQAAFNVSKDVEGG